MESSKSIEPFWPRKLVKVTPGTIQEIIRDSGEKLAAVSLAQIPRIPADAIIHDNGCGTGAATATIMGAVTPEVASSIQITGTDIDEAAVEAYRARSAALSWPAKGVVMNANALSFPDETFTHSIGNAMLFLVGNGGINAVKEMRRTLKPGGMLLVNCFAYNPHLEAVREASRATRPEGILPAWDSFEHWQDPAVIAGALEAGGFKKDMVIVRQREMFVNVGNFERHALLVWSFRGMPAAGWSKEDERSWDDAVDIVKRELRKTEGFKLGEDGTAIVRFLINIATATK